MGSYAIRACRISTVVFGASNEAVGGFSSSFPILTTATIPNWGPPPEVLQVVLSERDARSSYFDSQHC
jgi:tRNA(adenine34) deaminase